MLMMKKPFLLSQNKKSARNKNQISDNSDHCGDKVTSVTKCDFNSGKLKYQGDADLQPPMQTDSNVDCCKEIIDLESDFLMEPR